MTPKNSKIMPEMFVCDECASTIEEIKPRPSVNDIELFAWVGEDELGSGEIGLKQALCPAGYIPMVSVRKDRMLQPSIVDQLTAQAAQYGKKIRLCRFVFKEVVQETPSGE
jgi:hypothetical protein